MGHAQKPDHQGNPADRDIWRVTICPKKGPDITEHLLLTDDGAYELGRKLDEMWHRRLLYDFDMHRQRHLPLEEFERRVLGKIESGTWARA